MMNNSDRLDKSAKAESLYKFFKGNAFLTSGNVQLKSNYSKGKESPWSLAFAGHCVKDVFKIDDPMFCSKFVQAISGDGQEANKIMTLHSSSLASLLVFYSVSKDNPIYVMVDGKEEKFTESLFEVKNEVWEGSGNFSNVDVVLRGDNCILYLESKFSEYLGSGPVEVKMVDYYDTIYERLSDTLKDAGVHLMTKDGKRFLEREDKAAFYNEGLKQMISHYLGVTTEITAGRLNASGKIIALGEVLFNFEDRVPICAKKYESYKTAYSFLKKGLEGCVKEDDTNLIINDLTTYQCILRSESNHQFLQNLPERIREFYRFNEFI
ncbi:MAG: hypothetical protein II560_06300 [Bacteroidales bacterium]|nr:hypothetical protein [Bacteroidales bacterium]